MIKRLIAILLCLLIASPAWATFPTVDDSSGGSRSASTTPNIAMPATCASGKTLLVFLSSADAPGQTTITWPASWNEITDEGNTEANLQIAWFKSTGAEAGTNINPTLNQSAETAFIAYCIGNAADPATSPPEAGTPVEATTEFPDPPSLTPTGGAKDYLWFTALSAGTSARTADAYPSNYTNGTNQKGVNGANSGNIFVARRELNAASEDPGTFDLDASTTTPVVQTVVIHPAVPTTFVPSSPLYFQ